MRGPSTPEGTFGNIATDTGKDFRTGELQWLDNLEDVSCIPVGVYIMRWLWSEKHQRNMYHLLNVPGRTVVEMHSANFVGDKKQGWKCDMLGCIALGMNVQKLNGQMAVTDSRNAINAFEKEYFDGFAQDDIVLTIEDAPLQEAD